MGVKEPNKLRNTGEHGCVRSLKQCAKTFQPAVFSEENPNVFVGIIISKRPPENAILQVIAPLNVLLSKGVNLTIGQDDPLQFDFIRCVSQGCQAETMIDEKLLKQFESGKIGDVVIYESRSRGLRHLAPLDGFKEAYSNLH